MYNNYDLCSAHIKCIYEVDGLIYGQPQTDYTRTPINRNWLNRIKCGRCNTGGIQQPYFSIGTH